jgi:hypothetical protein
MEADFTAWSTALLATFKTSSPCECGSQESCCKEEKGDQEEKIMDSIEDVSLNSNFFPSIYQ